MADELIAGILKIKRDPGAPDPYTVAEIGGVQLAGTDEIDLMAYYNNWVSAQDLVHDDRSTSCLTAQLNQDIAFGTIVITEETPPRPKTALDP